MNHCVLLLSIIGDSGGPLFDKNGTQIGVVSYGLGKDMIVQTLAFAILVSRFSKHILHALMYGFVGCARNPYEDVYAGVAKHYDWIQTQIQNDECTFYPPGFFGRVVRFMSRTVQNFGLAVGNFILNILF